MSGKGSRSSGGYHSPEIPKLTSAKTTMEIKAQPKPYGAHVCDAMPDSFSIDWSERHDPWMHYEPEDIDGVSQMTVIEVAFCPFCGLDLGDAKREWERG